MALRLPQWSRRTWLEVLGFWMFGMLNNANYVIMNAGAKEISAGGVGLVYVANVLPVFVIKGSAPYWFHLVGYTTRIWLAAALMVASLQTVALTSSTSIQLVGVAIGALQSGLGEATVLALASKYDSQLMLTSWSSGTGMAGIGGYVWVLLFTEALEWGFNTALFAANLLPVCFMLTWYFVLPAPERKVGYELVDEVGNIAAVDEGAGVARVSDLNTADGSEPGATTSAEASSRGSANRDGEEEAVTDTKGHSTPTAYSPPMNARQRFYFILSLWPYMVPLVIVYTTEYALQAGTWAAIGVPDLDNKDDRDRFYKYSNLMYQVGVFISRSSGTIYKASRKELWIMPMVQTFMLAFFTFDAYLQFWVDYGLLFMAVLVGLLGGAVYVNAFCLIAREVRPDRVELALSGASIADTGGILLADVLGLVLQGCLYGYHNLTDDGDPPTITCGYSY